jgi:signal transduction histidine kinase
LKRTPTRLGEVVRRASRACAGLAQDRRVSVVEEVDGALPVLNLDAARLEQVFENLLANALQLAPADSVVRLRCEPAPGPGVACLVEDEGPGLPAEGRQLFEPFFTRRRGGTGLGLSIVQRIVEAHGGRVAAENRAEGGARFVVWLPAEVERGGERG